MFGVALGCVFAVLAALILAIAATGEVSHLGASRNVLLTSLTGGVPFALVAALFLRSWQFNAAAAGLSLILVGIGVVLLRHEPANEFEARLAANSVHRETVYADAIPGYLPTDRDYGNGLGGGTFSPDNPGAIPPDRYITITAYDKVTATDQLCGQPTAQDSLLRWGSCSVESDGLVYRHNDVQHGYQVHVDQAYVTVVGTAAVDRDVLRAAAKRLHLATADELGTIQQTGDYYAATIPGFHGQAAGPPPGMVYAPADDAGNGAQSVFITLSVSYEPSDGICFPPTTCTPDGTGLTYLRREDTHGYARRRGEMSVQLVGGLRVDKALLRQATLNARPATDDEIRRLFPAAKPHGIVDRLRQRLRTF